MKKILKIVLSFILIVPTIVGTNKVVKAADYYASIYGPNQVVAGETITVTGEIYATQWNASLSMNGSVVDSSSELENYEKNIYGSVSYSYQTSSSDIGTTITFVLSGEMTDFDQSNTSISKTHTVTVVAPENNNGGGNNGGSSNNGGGDNDTPSYEEPNDEPEEKSDDANLYSLTVDKGNLKPKFSSDVTEYTVELTSKETEITIDAYGDYRADVSGTGLKPLKVGGNSFTVDVTAEDGKTKKAYTINVNVKEVPTLFFNLGETKLGILNEVNNGDIPKGFKERKIFVQEKEVKAYSNDDASITLLYMTDEKDNKGFYIYDQTKIAIVGLYRPMIIDNQSVFALSIDSELQKIEDMKLSTTSIQGEVLDAFVFQDEDLSNFTVLYMLNGDGKPTYYIYDSETQKLVAYPENAPLTAKDIEEFVVDKKTPWLLYGGIALGALVVIGGGAFFILKKKKDDKMNNGDKGDGTSHEDKPKPKEKAKAQPAPEKKKEKERKLVTDETFFKEVPKEELEEDGVILGEDGIPLSIENALNEIEKTGLDDTTGFLTVSEMEKMDNQSTSPVEEDEDDWLDEKMVNSIFDDND